jgi:hypothetical protein
VQCLKVEILIPKFYNDKRQMEASKRRITYQEIVRQFKGCTEDKSPLIGNWIDPKTGNKYSDRNFSYWVICDDKVDTTYFLDDLKKRLKQRYEQEEIMMYSISINVI